ncbi:MAG: AraC family transcriptional regulator [Butyrivibrio sp.]|jgi:AraC-like DNA-binding protein|nr:AraC family transcriptional regulator [Butyrivibrio sp.]
MKNISERVSLFRELLSCVNNIYLTEFDAGYNVISTSFPDQNLMALFLMCDTEIMNNPPSLDREAARIKNGPSIFTNEIGMSWMSEIVTEEGRVSRIYMIGPVFLDDYSVQDIERKIDSLISSISIKRSFMEILKKMAIIDLNRFYEYGIMFHFCITGEKIAVSDFDYPISGEDRKKDDFLAEKHGTYMAENEILKLVETGNLNYKKEMEKYVTIGTTGRLSEKNYIRHAKNIVIVFAALCTRAAIRGGLPSETAYQLREQYINSVERAGTLAKINETNFAMMGDFVQRVHKNKVLSESMSPQIRETCDYIGLHLNEKLEIRMLAARHGYTDYYFSNKFKHETGQSLCDYLNEQRIGKAREMLESTSMEVQDICNELGYNSQSYFGKIFRQAVGITPGQYRATYGTGGEKCISEKM